MITLPQNVDAMKIGTLLFLGNSALNPLRERSLAGRGKSITIIQAGVRDVA